MTDSRSHPGLARTVVVCAVFALVGAAAMAWFQAFELSSRTKYHRDLTQSPHWVAYHGDSFSENDLLVRYATYNETFLQNAIYRVGTRFLDLLPLNKLVAMAIFAMTAALFYLLVARMSGARVGVLAALFFIVFPRSSYEIAGGFSKAWAIAFVLLAVYVVEQREWRILTWAMPLAALAYPVSPVLMGAIVSVGLVLELPRSPREALKLPGLRYLAMGSALALVPLLYKYFTPPEFIGPMVTHARMREMWDAGMSSERPLPIWEEALYYVDHPFFIFGSIAVIVLLLVTRRGLVWKRSWTALVIASGGAYLLAQSVVPRLYLPDRYTRYSIAVLLVLWCAHNWERALALLARPWVRNFATAALVTVVALSFPDTFKQCEGRKSQGIWEDRGHLAEISAVVARQPQPVLVAGHPNVTACVMLQARRPVLVINRMFHHWFVDYRARIDERYRDTIRAIYSIDARDVNRLAEKYGVTHLIVEPRMFDKRARLRGRVYRREYDEFVISLAEGRRDFILDPPPPEHVVFENEDYWLVRLPLEDHGM